MLSRIYLHSSLSFYNNINSEIRLNYKKNYLMRRFSCTIGRDQACWFFHISHLLYHTLSLIEPTQSLIRSLLILFSCVFLSAWFSSKLLFLASISLCHQGFWKHCIRVRGLRKEEIQWLLILFRAFELLFVGYWWGILPWSCRSLK